ncbi:hypothetical protein ASPZODRAFT_549861 [Penicilliopsis zonata CBS 506.65]|uniref:Ketoreductase (KR) domain-containing protein n=1 Tax=Penicilliopsis zonata CBS 506.65 TaxID=1073090 RepID=A0A1L9SDR7_9EURO|nr:hypothetical protein ASPZODRAFT_549861 [Penicilliopsis zonata CBS 506.65]OJJ45234.1 hypothetical protein ASPZODRAFT_549861 [Penicilliopsis zonata CBS 506.65]
MPSFGNFIYAQFIAKYPVPTTSFASHTVIVTGGNGGLGKETIKHIVRNGASKVILTSRSRSRGEAAKAEIEDETKCSKSVIEVWELDLESAASIKGFVDKVNGLPRLDVMINNAGIQGVEFKIVHGTERILGVNVIGTFLLAMQVVPKLKETARRYGVTPRMTFVGSALYDAASYPNDPGDDIFEWFTDESRVNKFAQYVNPCLFGCFPFSN